MRETSQEVFQRLRAIIYFALRHDISIDECMSIIETEFLLGLIERAYHRKILLTSSEATSIIRNFDTMLHSIPSLEEEYQKSGLVKKG